MYPTGKHPLFPYSMEERRDILSTIGKDEKQIQEDANTIFEWYQKQPHLPEGAMHKQLIEIGIIAAKGSPEIFKQRIDDYYKYRSQAPELLSDRKEILNDPNFELWDFFVQVPMPKLYQGKRIAVTKLIETDASKCNTIAVMINLLMLGDIRAVNDCMLGDIWIADFRNITMGHLLRINPIHLQKITRIVQDGFHLRVYGIHIILSNGMSNIIQYIQNLIKPFVSAKIMSRTKFHNSFESLYDDVPKEYLPKDLGGDLPSTTDIRDEYRKLLKSEKTKQFLIDASDHVSDESKRAKKVIDEECIFGTFKKLQLD